MRVVEAHFERLDEIDVYQALGAIGVYVLWAPNAKARPTYIGEGNLLDRLNESKQFYGPYMDGVVALMGYEPSRTAKKEAEIVEVALLDASDAVDRRPIDNSSDGKTSRIAKILDTEATLRIRITGRDPLLSPARAPMSGPKLLHYRRLEVGDVLEHAWKTRPRA